MAEERSAAKTLDEGREGASNVVIATLTRISEAREAIEQGRFAEAASRLQEAQGRVTSLVAVEQHLAPYAGKHTVRGRELDGGMVLDGLGTITEVQNITDHGDDCPEAVFEIRLDSGDVRRVYADQEVLVGAADEGAANS